MTAGLVDAQSYPNLAYMIERQSEQTPRHANFLKKRFSGSTARHLAIVEVLAGQIRRLCEAHDLNTFLEDYDWICRVMLDEEDYFRRNGEYRLKTFAEANAQVYSDDVLMDHYMNGLLLTQLWWSNHADVFGYFLDSFVSGNVDGYRHLEIGPGHGLYLYPIAADPRCRHIEAWDVSPQSVENTRTALLALGITRPVELKVQDMFDAASRNGAFDSIVFSEVLEHLEEPARALAMLRDLLSDEGRLFINMPINSPAPDHLFLLRAPEEVTKFVSDNGFEIESFTFEPQTNATLEKARRLELTISCAVIARKTR